MKYITFFTFAIVLFFSSCKEEKQDVTLNFKLVYDGEPLVMFEEYNYPTGEQMIFSRFSFYLSNIVINHQDGQDQLLDVTYLNFTTQNSTLTGAEEGLSLSFDGLEDKNYDQLFMSIGVNPISNALTPADFPSDNDLSKTSEYWPGWDSYVFTKTEGQIDLGQPQMSGFSLHTGGDEAKVDYLLDVSQLQPGKKETVVITIDLKKYFKNYDIEKHPNLHTLSHKPQVLELTNNLKEALSIDFN